MIMDRDKYLKQLISHKHNRRVKVITGIRRCGKSYLLNELFYQHLLSEGVKKNHIIQLAFDDYGNKRLRDPDECYKYLTEQIDENEADSYYILLDEVQMLDDFTDVLNGLLHIKNVDVYVTGSNSRFLSKDVATEFRGRGDEIRMYPLTFSEFSAAYLKKYRERREKSADDALTIVNVGIEAIWSEYYTYGGLPYILELDSDEEKIKYLGDLFAETYLRDIIERNNVKNDAELDTLVDIAASDIGTLTNPKRIADTFRSRGVSGISAPTIKKYLDYLQDSFIIQEAKRYDVKGRKYIGTPLKYYFGDLGLRNARLNFRQMAAEEGHLMENVIYNELCYRGYSVDVGMVEYRKRENGSYTKTQTEIDFVANSGSRRYYIQSALAMLSDEKRSQEFRPLRNVGDSFKKIVVIKGSIKPSVDNDGIVTMGLFDFLLDQNSLEK